MSIQSITPKRFAAMDRNCQRMCWLLDMHGVELSWPDGIPRFVHQLDTDRHLAMDFWALVRALRRSETSALGQQQILEMVISCICGANPLPWRHEDRTALDQFTKMLEASDAAADSAANLPDALLVPGPNEVWPMAKTGSHVHQDDPDKLFFPDDPLQSTKTVVSLGFQPSSAIAPQTLSQHLDEALSRLELASLELKVHLDNLDNRMSRIEPHLEDITALVTSTLGASSLQPSTQPSTPDALPLDATAPEAFLPKAPEPEAFIPQTSVLQAVTLESPTPIASAQEMPTPPSTLQREIVAAHDELFFPEPDDEPEISFRDRAPEGWAASTFASWPEKAQTAWANRPRWKGTLPTLPPHLLPDLKQRWRDSAQFVSNRLKIIHLRHIAIVSSALVALLIGRMIFVSAHRHPVGTQMASPLEIKPAEHPDARTIDNPVSDTIPPAVTGSVTISPVSQHSPATTTAAPQTSATRKKQGQGQELIAKPTFKWLGDNPETQSRNQDGKAGADRNP